MMIKKLLFLLLIFTCTTAFDLGDLEKKIKKAKEKAEKIKEDTRKVKAVTGTFSEKDEIEMGGVIISSLLGAAPLVDDPALQNYVNHVGYWVALQSSRPNLPWTFGVLENENVNAFAAPGGYILLTKGLLRYLQSEAELAAVLAHEIVHIEDNHHLDVLKKSSRLNLVAGWTVKQVDDKEKQAKVDKLVSAGTNLYSKGLDKKTEYHADQHSIELLMKAGYDPYALLNVLTTLDSIKADASELALLNKTHPAFSQRIESLDAIIDRLVPPTFTGQTVASRYLKYKANL